MSEINNQDREFIERTLKIIKDYKGVYEVTLAINCSIGLLIYPKERMLRFINDSVVDNFVRDRVKPKSSSTKDFIKHLRNAISHSRFEIINDKGSISEINFKDYDYVNGRVTEKINFNITLTVEEFTTITQKIGNSILGKENI